MNKERVFIAHRVTGEDFQKLEKTVKGICDAVGEAGYNHYCTFLEEIANPKKFKNWSAADFLKYAVKKIDVSEIVLFYVNSEDKSDGVSVEAGYSWAKGKRRVLLVNRKVKNTYLRELADKVIEFDDINDAYKKIRRGL